MFDPEDFVEESVKAIKDQIEGKAIIACSGGVDSVVASVLASRALGEDLLAVFIDTGFMRKGEIEQVKKTGQIFLQTWTFNQPVQPIKILTENPLE